MIDLHCHILPGVDDGPEIFAEAVAMCQAAAADGCIAMIATPHQRRGEWWNGDRERLAAVHRKLAAAVAAAGSPLRILLGAEVHADDQLLAEVERLPGGSILTLGGSRCLLVELDGLCTSEGAAHLVHELVVAGWRPVLAHPEFIPCLAGNVAAVESLVGLGATIQITAMSLTGDFGRRPQQSVERLLDAGLVHFVASDAHDLLHRPPGLSRAWRLLSARWGEEAAWRLCHDNAQALLTATAPPEAGGDLGGKARREAHLARPARRVPGVVEEPTAAAAGPCS